MSAGTVRLISLEVDYSSVEVDVIVCLLNWRLRSLTLKVESGKLCLRLLELSSSEG